MPKASAASNSPVLMPFVAVSLSRFVSEPEVAGSNTPPNCNTPIIVPKANVPGTMGITPLMVKILLGTRWRGAK